MKEEDVIQYPLLTEKSMDRVEKNNELVLIVHMDANKNQVSEAVSKAFNVKVERVKTMIDTKGRKRAFVRLAQENPAIDIMTRMGVI